MIDYAFDWNVDKNDVIYKFDFDARDLQVLMTKIDDVNTYL